MRQLLRSLRAWPPLNRPLTAAIRGACRAAGSTPEVVVRHLHRMGDVEAALPGGQTLRLRSLGDDWVSNQVFWRGWLGYEPETTLAFYHLARRSAGTVDVGAYVGFFTLLAAHANPRAPVVAIEPLDEPRRRLERHVAVNGLANVRVVAAAAGEAEGRRHFYTVPTAMPSSSSLSAAFMQRSGLAPVSLEVPVRTLDALVSEHGLAKVDLLKIDTETTEPDVLAGARETLARDRPDIVCEVLQGQGTGPRIRALLDPHGYRYFLLTPSGLREDASLAGHPEWLNYLFTTRDHPDDLSRLPGLR